MASTLNLREEKPVWSSCTVALRQTNNSLNHEHGDVKGKKEKKTVIMMMIMIMIMIIMFRRMIVLVMVMMLMMISSSSNHTCEMDNVDRVVLFCIFSAKVKNTVELWYLWPCWKWLGGYICKVLWLWSWKFNRLVSLVVKGFASRVADPGFYSCLRHGDFFRVESYQWSTNWHSSGYPVRRLVLQGQYWDWLALCQYTVTWWDKVWSAASISVWQHAQLSEQIHPWDS